MNRSCLLRAVVLPLALLITVLCASCNPADSTEDTPATEENTSQTEEDQVLYIDSSVVTSIYIRWKTSTYDLLVSTDNEPELFAFLLDAVDGSYTSAEEYANTGADAPTLYLYSGEDRLLHFSVLGTRIVYDGYWYTHDEGDLPGEELDDALLPFETEEHRLEHNTANNTFYRAGSYGADIVEIP